MTNPDRSSRRAVRVEAHVLIGALHDAGEMLHGWEGIVEVVEEALPLSVLGGIPEADGVILQRLPFDEQQVLALDFEAALELVGVIARHGGDDR